MKSSINLPEVAIVGRPNVGKSTLFNRLIGWRKAIEFKEAGTTRDCLYELVTWKKKSFWLVDTGGLSFDAKDDWAKPIEQQVKKAIDQARVCLFLVDGQENLTAADEALAQNLRKSKKQVLLVGNKIDIDRHEANLAEFYRLGFGKPHPVSALHDRGIDVLFNEISRLLGDVNQQENLQDTVRFTLIGEPNTGKSTLFNALIGEYRSLVSPIAGTTRDFVEEWIKMENYAVCLTDTGGLKRNKHFKTVPAYLSAIRSKQIIQKTDVAFLLMDSARGPQRDTRMIFDLAFEAKKPCILIVNKWDLAKNIPQADYTKAIHREFHFLKSVPIFYISSLTKRNFTSPFKFGLELWKKINTPIDQKQLDQFLKSIVNHPLFLSCQFTKLEQTKTNPLTLLLHTKRKDGVTVERKRALVNRIRESFHCEGIPIILKLK